MTRRPTLALAVLLSGLALGIPARHALAQTAPDRQTITATDLNSEQIDRLREYVGGAFQRLSNPEPREIKAGRDMLLAPLRERDISFRFRQEYSNLVVPKLRELPADSELMSINALRIAGDLATQESTALLEERLEDASVAVRYAAIAGLGRTFQAIAGSSPAITTDRAAGLIGKIGGRIVAEPSFVVADAGVRALLSAMAVERANFDVRGAAYRSLVQSMNERLKQAGGSPHDPDLVVPAVRTAQAARDALAVAGPRALNTSEAKLAAELSGHLTAYVRRRMQAGDFPMDDAAMRDAAAQIVVVPETTVPLAASKLGGSVQTPTGMGDDLKAGTQAGDRAFFDKSLALLMALQKPPFDFPVGHFLTEERAARP